MSAEDQSQGEPSSAQSTVARHRPAEAVPMSSLGGGGSPSPRRRLAGLATLVFVVAIAGASWLVAGALKDSGGRGFTRPLLFSSFVAGREPDQIFSVDSKGHVERVGAPGWRNSTPAWSPDGGRIAFASYTTPAARAPGGAPQLWVMALDGSGPTLLGRGGDFQPSWSPDGRSIVFVSGEDSGSPGALQLFTVRPDGTQRTKLSPDPSLAYGHPSWSPDSDKVAYHARAAGARDNDIYVLTLSSGTVVRLTHAHASEEAPSWSPDGSRIVFMSTIAGNSDVYVMNADGSGLKRLTDSPALDAYPVFSPDGKKIAFVSTSTGESQVFVMNPDGSKVRRLTSTPGNKSYLSW